MSLKDSILRQQGLVKAAAFANKFKMSLANRPQKHTETKIVVREPTPIQRPTSAVANAAELVLYQ